jgi:hypothetical protein
MCVARGNARCSVCGERDELYLGYYRYHIQADVRFIARKGQQTYRLSVAALRRFISPLSPERRGERLIAETTEERRGVWSARKHLLYGVVFARYSYVREWSQFKLFCFPILNLRDVSYFLTE